MPDIPGIDPPLAEAEGGRASPVGTVGCVLPSALPRRALHTTPAAAPTRSKMTAAAVTIMYRRTCPPPRGPRTGLRLARHRDPSVIVPQLVMIVPVARSISTVASYTCFRESV